MKELSGTKTAEYNEIQGPWTPDEICQNIKLMMNIYESGISRSQEIL